MGPLSPLEIWGRKQNAAVLQESWMFQLGIISCSPTQCFMFEETDTPRGQVTCFRLHSKFRAELGVAACHPNSVPAVLSPGAHSQGWYQQSSLYLRSGHCMCHLDSCATVHDMFVSRARVQVGQFFNPSWDCRLPNWPASPWLVVSEQCTRAGNVPGTVPSHSWVKTPPKSGFP